MRKKFGVILTMTALILSTGCSDQSNQENSVQDDQGTAANHEGQGNGNQTGQGRGNEAGQKSEWIEISGSAVAFDEYGMQVLESTMGDKGGGGMFAIVNLEDEPRDILFNEETVFEVQEIRGGGEAGVDQIREGSYEDLNLNSSVTVFGSYQDSVFVAERVEIMDFVDLDF